ncbi:hypothetical protein [Kibdelosporangium philippinense]|uniref:hypothetical protein n=1 Tax=Kibdelosporangium philippinense TaxID=211113 RepID=UPI00360A6527
MSRSLQLEINGRTVVSSGPSWQLTEGRRCTAPCSRVRPTTPGVLLRGGHCRDCSQHPAGSARCRPLRLDERDTTDAVPLRTGGVVRQLAGGYACQPRRTSTLLWACPWRRTSVEVEVPVNSTAEVILPSGVKHVFGSGKHLVRMAEAR